MILSFTLQKPEKRIDILSFQFQGFIAKAERRMFLENLPDKGLEISEDKVAQLYNVFMPAQYDNNSNRIILHGSSLQLMYLKEKSSLADKGAALLTLETKLGLKFVMELSNELLGQKITYQIQSPNFYNDNNKGNSMADNEAQFARHLW